MRLTELIENLCLDINSLDRRVINQAITSNYTDHDLVNLARTFLRGIGKQHEIDGDVINTLWGITDYHLEHDQITPRQRVYVIQNIITNWHHMRVEMRATLNL